MKTFFKSFSSQGKEEQEVKKSRKNSCMRRMEVNAPFVGF